MKNVLDLLCQAIKQDEKTRKMKTETIKKEVVQLNKIERRAKQIQYQLDQLNNRWDKKYEKVKDTIEWRENCERRGVMVDYNFADVLA